MEILFGYRCDLSKTRQQPFIKPHCDVCHTVMEPGVQVIDDEGYAYRDHPTLNDGEIWIHDSLALIVFFCPKCLKAKVQWNQA